MVSNWRFAIQYGKATVNLQIFKHLVHFLLVLERLLEHNNLILHMFYYANSLVNSITHFSRSLVSILTILREPSFKCGRYGIVKMLTNDPEKCVMTQFLKAPLAYVFSCHMRCYNSPPVRIRSAVASFSSFLPPFLSQICLQRTLLLSTSSIRVR